MRLDPRLTPARPDLAAEALRGQVDAPRFVEPTMHQVTAPVLDMRDRPDASAPLSTQLLFGEVVDLYDQADGWAWVQNRADAYVGYVRATGLGTGPAPSHRVRTLSAQLYATPTLKAPPERTLPWGACVAIDSRREGDYLGTADGLWCHDRHLTATADPRDPVAMAQALMGASYLWGGRSVWGLDCSALVQLAAAAAGHPCPRDSDQQETVGDPVEGPPQHGDLVFWRGHVGLVADGRDLVHANAHHMAVVREPLADAIARIGATDAGPVTAIRRPPWA